MHTPPVYAGFWRRTAATLIDTTLLLAVLMPLLYLLYGAEYFSAGRAAFSYAGPADFILNQVLPFIAAVFLWVRFRATPGKQLLSCAVVDARTLEPLRIRQAAWRYVAYLASVLSFGLGFLWIARDRRKRGWHDLLARTVVLYIPHEEADKSLAELMREAG